MELAIDEVPPDERGSREALRVICRVLQPAEVPNRCLAGAALGGLDGDAVFDAAIIRLGNDRIAICPGGLATGLND
jgi:hypothetical protein